MARWNGDSVPGPRGRRRVDHHPSHLSPARARLARLHRRAVAALVFGDEVSQVIQEPDIGKVILEHTADSHVIELPWGTVSLPGPWYIPGTHIDVSPTKHVVFMLLAAVLVFITIWWGGRQVERRHREVN